MRVFVITLVGLLFGGFQVSTPTIPPTTEPYQQENFSCTGNPDGRLFNSAYEKSGYGRFRIVADLNFDGREDVILTRSERKDGTGCGNASCDVRIYLQQSDGTYLDVAFGLHPLAAALRMTKPGEGQLVTYGRVNAGEGTIGFFNVTSNSVTLANRQTLHINDSERDAALYQSWFGGNLRLKTEYAGCLGEKLQWSVF